MPSHAARIRARNIQNAQHDTHHAERVKTAYSARQRPILTRYYTHENTRNAIHTPRTLYTAFFVLGISVYYRTLKRVSQRVTAPCASMLLYVGARVCAARFGLSRLTRPVPFQLDSTNQSGACNPGRFSYLRLTRFCYT